MVRYIDANKLQEAFEKIADEPDYMHEGENWQTGIYLAGTIADKQPTADVEEVKHGEWKIETDNYGCEYVMCSVCEKEYYPIDEDMPCTALNYCPNCGADMRGDAE